MDTPLQIRAALATSLAPLLQSNGGPLGQILDYPASNVQPPMAYIADGEVSYDFTMGRGSDGPVNFVVVALFPATQDIAQQEYLDALRAGTGAHSVKTLVEADRTLGGTCQSLRVSKLSRSQLYETPGQPPRVGCEWTVEVYT